jgi:hypothetical protein
VIEPAGVKKPFWKFWQQNAERGSQ